VGTLFKILPKNYLGDWGEMESWAQGTGSAPDGWLRATNPTITRESTQVKYGSYAALVQASSGAIGGLYRTIPNGDDYAGRTFTLGVWGRSGSTGPYIQLNDGVASKTVHLDGNNAYVFYTTPAMKLDYNATQIFIGLFASINQTAYFDSAVLCEGEDLFTDFTGNIDVSQWRPALDMKLDQYEIPQEEGSIIPGTHLRGRTIDIRGSVVGTDAASARWNFDGLMKSLMSWKPDEKRNAYLYDDRVAESFLRSFNWDYQNNLRMIRFDINLAVPKSNVRYINKLRHRQVISGTVTEFNFIYNGNAETKPVISFIADQGAAITTCQLENLTTQENIIISGTVPNTAAMDIDCDAGSVFNSSVNAISQFGTSDFMKIVRGTNYFRFSGSNCKLHIDYYERFL